MNSKEWIEYLNRTDGLQGFEDEIDLEKLEIENKRLKKELRQYEQTSKI